jgi:energy-coupling factor transporter ATP-binding protein EcfA2
MKIIELKSNNVKRLRAVELTLDEKQNLVLITGRNGQGKTSVLDSIWYALGGKKAAPEKPIREGEEKAEIEIDLGGFIVTRTFTQKGSYLKVTNKDGASYSNPQEFLDYIIGNLSFDPLEFSRLEPKKQVEALTKIVGLDFSEFDKKKKEWTDERLLVGRELKTIGQINPETIEKMKLVSQEPINIQELQDKYKGAIENTNRRSNLTTRRDEIVKQIALLQDEFRTIEDELKEIPELESASVKEELDRALIAVDEQREAKRILADNDKYIAKQKEYDDLTENLKSLEEDKKVKLSKAEMPIEGLSWNEDKVMFKDIPYEQISSAEQLKVSMAIAMANNPKLKIVIIRDGSLLDQDNLKVIEEMAKDKDFQVWVEKVDDSGKVGIYIEDGEIKQINDVKKTNVKKNITRKNGSRKITTTEGESD